MKRNRFSEGQIIAILKEHEAGISTAVLSDCREIVSTGCISGISVRSTLPRCPDHTLLLLL
ncbi:hypothetical protein SAMN02927924_01961 [Sphingobium faniae]|nr:hypothetical protein SAMN02927924_01961 [Sphingobium faniae]